jgi:hypothetical protein
LGNLFNGLPSFVHCKTFRIFTSRFTRYKFCKFFRLCEIETFGSIEILGTTYTRRSMFEKRNKFFQLISAPFCEVNRQVL